MEGFNWSIVFWIAGLIFVYLFGIYEGRGQGRKKRIEEEQKDKKNTPPDVVEVNDPGVMRIKNEQGTISLELDGQHVNTHALTSDQRRRLIELINMMRPWLESKPVQAPPPPPKPATEPRTSSPPQTVRAASQDAAKPKSKGSGKKEEDEDKEDTAPTTIVGQINLILQAQIAGTPLAGKGVSLMESASGGANVFVGVKRYESVDDVPDEDVKAAIRAAIAEWEKKFTPGLS